MEENQKNQKVRFVSQELFKNGSTKLHFVESEMYEVLYNLGFRFVRIDRKPFIYKLEEGEKVLLVRHFQELRDSFCDYIKKLDIRERT